MQSFFPCNILGKLTIAYSLITTILGFNSDFELKDAFNIMKRFQSVYLLNCTAFNRFMTCNTSQHPLKQIAPKTAPPYKVFRFIAQHGLSNGSQKTYE